MFLCKWCLPENQAKQVLKRVFIFLRKHPPFSVDVVYDLIMPNYAQTTVLQTYSDMYLYKPDVYFKASNL